MQDVKISSQKSFFRTDRRRKTSHMFLGFFLEIFQEKITQFCQIDSVSGDELNGNKYNLGRTLSHNPD